MESETDATTRSSTDLAPGADGAPPRTGSGRTAATQLAARHSRRRPPTRPRPHRGPAGVGRGHDLTDEDADGRAGGAEARGTSTRTATMRTPHLHQEVAGQRPVGPVRLQQAAVEREQDEEGGGGQDRGDADAALLVQQHGHAVPAGEHDHGPDQDEQVACRCTRPAQRRTRWPLPSSCQMVTRRTTATTTADPGMERMRYRPVSWLRTP